jgi:pilus assembly protein CpaB
MNTKKIWLWAVFFGILASATLYFALYSEGGPAASPEKAVSANTSPTGTPSAQATSPANTAPKKDPAIPVKLSVEQGKRAMTISVNDLQGVYGFLTPGVSVDVVLMMPPIEDLKDPGGQPIPKEKQEVAHILLQNKKVLAVGKASAKSYDQTKDIPYAAVTLEVLPIEGAALALAEPKGDFVLMMRPQDDATSSPQTQISVEQLNKGEIPK